MMDPNRGVKKRTGNVRKEEQRSKILALINHHITQCQDSNSIGKLTVELEFVRGGSLKSPYIEYKGSWRFVDKIDGLDGLS